MNSFENGLGDSMQVARSQPLALFSIGMHRTPKISLAPALIVFLAIAGAACQTPISVVVDFDPEADFDGFRSYAWISDDTLLPQVDGVQQGQPISPIDDKRIRRATDAGLAAKGWKQVGREEADLIVSYGVGAAEKTEIYQTPYTFDHYRHGYGYGSWYSRSAIHSRDYTEGTLTLEFFDRRTKQAAWVGWASQRLRDSDERAEVIDRAVEKILLDFPSRT